jgi:hypothetical protein
MNGAKPKIFVFEPFPVADPAKLAAKLAVYEGSLVGLTRLTLTAVDVVTIGYPGIDKGPHVEFVFAAAA